MADEDTVASVSEKSSSEVTGSEQTSTSDLPDFDMAGAVEGIAEDLGLEPDEPKEAAGEKEETLKDGAVAAQKTDPASPDTPAAPTSVAPDTWTKEAKEGWANLPPTIQAEVQKREADIAKYVAETNPTVEIGKGFEKLCEPYAGVFQQFKVNPWNHVNSLLQAHSILMFGNPQQKAHVALGLLKDAGIQPSRIADGDFAKAFEAQPNQEYQRLQSRIAELEGGVTRVMTGFDAQRSAEREQLVSAFAADPSHPYFWDVADDVVQLLDSGVAKNLDQAYDKAVWTNPVTRQKEVERVATEKAAKATKAAADKVRSSRKAASVNVSGNGSAGGATSIPGNWEDTLTESLADIRSRP